MFLSDKGLSEALGAGHIAVVPPSRLAPASIELRLGTSIARPVDSLQGRGRLGIPRRLRELSSEDYEFAYGLGEGEEITIEPLQFMLASTLEWIQLDAGHMGFVVGKSTTARGRIAVECAGLVDPGWEGRLTLELFNMGASPVILTVGDEIAQLAVARLLAPATRPYGSEGLGSRYQGDTTVAAPKPRRPFWSPRLPEASQTQDPMEASR